MAHSSCTDHRPGIIALGGLPAIIVSLSYANLQGVQRRKDNTAGSEIGLRSQLCAHDGLHGQEIPRANAALHYHSQVSSR